MRPSTARSVTMGKAASRTLELLDALRERDATATREDVVELMLALSTDVRAGLVGAEEANAALEALGLIARCVDLEEQHGGDVPLPPAMVMVGRLAARLFAGELTLDEFERCVATIAPRRG